MTIREQFAPLIRAIGVRRTARLAGIPQSTLSEWLSDNPARRRVRLADPLIDSLARALGVTLTVSDSPNTEE